jgi:fatty acid amide hydrolase 2
VTAGTVVSACIARSEQVHAFLNCLAERRFEEALAEARKVDAFLAETTKTEDEIEAETPFLGVPFSCKESLAVKGEKIRFLEKIKSKEDKMNLYVKEKKSTSQFFG